VFFLPQFRTLGSRLFWFSQLHFFSFFPKGKTTVFLDAKETLELIANNRMSFSRFGEGELRMAFSQGSTIHEKSNLRQAKMLRRILKSPNPKVLLGLNSHYAKNNEWRLVSNLLRSPKKPSRFDSILAPNDITILDRKKQRAELLRYSIFLQRYSVTSIWGEASTFNFGIYEDHYVANTLDQLEQEVMSLFRARNILLVAPRIPANGIPLSTIFDMPSASTNIVHHYIVPSANAFSCYEDILNFVANNLSKVDLVVVQAGVTATVLAHEITALFDIQTIDIGGLILPSTLDL
jgi:hypothetical protein